MPSTKIPKRLHQKPRRDRAQAIEVTGHAVSVATIKTDPKWLELVYEAIVSLAHARQNFTSDDVWDEVEDRIVNMDIEAPKDYQAAGAIFRRAVVAGVIVDTMTVVKSDRPKAHRKELTVWRSA